MHFSDLEAVVDEACASSVRSLSYWHEPGAYPLTYKTIGRVMDEAARKFPDRDAIVSCDENKRLTFRQLAEEANIVAANLRACGFRAGERMAICGPNTIDWLVSFLACAKLGLISVLLNPAYEKREIKYCLNKVTASGLIISDTFKSKDNVAVMRELCPDMDRGEFGDIPKLRHIYFLTETESRNSFATLKSVNTERVEPGPNPDDIANIQFTSGTTGWPKAALLTHTNFVNNSFFINNRVPEMPEPKRLCCSVPFFHAFGTCVAISSIFHTGTTLVAPSRYYSPRRNLEAIERERCNIVNGTPTMYVDLVDQQEKRHADIRTLTYAMVGGSPTSPELFVKIQNILGVRSVFSVYGLTETSASVFFSPPTQTHEQMTNTVGKVQDHVQVKVVNERDELVRFGEPGELLVKGYLLCKGYWDDPEKTRELIGEDGWLRTGDKFILRQDGFGQIVGRIKDMIIRGGENIFPVEIENLLNGHPSVLESQVIGVRDERMGEEIMACVRLRAGKSLTIDDVKQFCDGQLAKFKIPKYLVVLDEFPKTHSGKIIKNKLREQFGDVRR